MRVVWLVAPAVPALVAGPAAGAGGASLGVAAAEPPPAMEAPVVRF